MFDTTRLSIELQSIPSPFQAGSSDAEVSEASGRKSAARAPLVTIFGAGIAGLTAAHELIERGFAVQLVEPSRSADEEYAVEIGGLARNQVGRIAESPEVLHQQTTEADAEYRERLRTVIQLRANGRMQAVQPRFAIPWRIPFGPRQPPRDPATLDLELADAWKIPNLVKLRVVWETIKDAYRSYRAAFQRGADGTGGGETVPAQTLPPDWMAREILCVEVRGHTDNDAAEGENRDVSERRANAVIDLFAEWNDKENRPLGPNPKDCFRAIGIGSVEPLGDQREKADRDRSNRVEFRVIERLIPGEHGYRFFPAFYRHLFDTMRRTPVLDALDQATGETAFDRLVATAHLGLALGDGRPPASVETRRVHSFEELRRLSELFLSRLHVTQRDLLRFQIRLLKFLTSSAERRAREYEHQTWWSFLGGDAERGYSPQMRHYLMETSQALVAMNAEETDARSHGNIVAQLQLQYLENRYDFTLNGPTSDVWLRGWKQYLKRQGVRFFLGELATLRWTDDATTGCELLPVTSHRTGRLLARPAAARGTGGTSGGSAPTEGRLEVTIEVLDDDEGDYTILVSGAKFGRRVYCHSARRNPHQRDRRGREDIATKLAERIKDDKRLSARRDGTRIVLAHLNESTAANRIEEDLWIDVADVHGNLRVVGDPVPEDARHRYRSHEDEIAERPDFYVMALPLTEASRIVCNAEPDRPGLLHGCLAELLEFNRRSGLRTPRGEIVRPSRNADGRPPRDYPLRDFAGVQYYFQNQVRIGKGHIYFPHAEWGLSSISQPAYWRERLSPAGPFMGQLSVDIGNFYLPAAPRLGNRVGRSGWNSTAEEIAAEVWFQVRRGLDRERAGALAAPSYYHLDRGLVFDDARGRTFRDEVRIRVQADPDANEYTVWIHGEPFSHHGPTADDVVRDLERTIAGAPFGSLTVERDAGKEEPGQEPAGNDAARQVKAPGAAAPVATGGDSAIVLRIRSTVPDDAALIIVNDRRPGLYEVVIGDRSYQYVQPPPPLRSRPDLRNGVFEALVRDPDLRVTPELSGDTGILLLPRGADQLPPVRARNDHQQLTIVHGSTLHVRLEHCGGKLSFVDGERATIGFNETPFLINVPGQWQYRPGLLQPSEVTFEETLLRPGRDERVRYRISNRRWVAAGTYMATTTQLTTMEAANESARHAVNAILRCLAFRPGTDYNAQGRVFGDLTEIWDPEMHELDELEPLKRLDRRLAAEGLPHVMDILKIIDAVDAMPMHGKPSHDPIANALHLAQHVADGMHKDWSFLRHTIGDLFTQAVERTHDGVDPLSVLREMRHGPAGVLNHLGQILQTLLSRTGGGPGPAPRPPDSAG